MAEYDDIKDGFNAGYVLHKHEPELAKQLAETYKDVDGDYFKAFISGTEEYAREIKIERGKKFPGFDNVHLSAPSTKDKNKNRQEPDMDLEK